MKINWFEKYRHVVSVGLGIFLCLIVILVWRANNKRLQISLENKVSDTSHLVAQQFQNALLDNLNKLTNLKKRLEITDGNYFKYWNKDAAFIVNQNPSFHFVEWIDSTGIIKRVEPLSDNREAIGLDITKLDYRSSNWLKAKKDSVLNLTPWLELIQGDFAFLIDEPIFIRNEFRGTITAGIDPTLQFNNIMQGLEKYHVKIRDDKGTLFYSFGDSSGIQDLNHFKVYRQIQVTDVNNGEWSMTMVPNQLFMEDDALNGNMDGFVMAVILCCLISASFFFMLKSSAAEKSHKEANQKLRSLIDSSPLAIFIVNTDGIVTDFWNDAAQEMFGWKQHAVLGGTMPFVKDENREQFKKLMRSCIEDGELKNEEVIVTRKDGSEGIFLLNVGMINQDEQQMLVMVEDITELKQYERKLEQSLEEKEVLLSEIHHRVKNNLAIVAGLISLQKESVNNEGISHLLNETQNRIFSIAGVHELLYKTETFSEICLSDYIDRLLKQLQDTYGSQSVQFSKSFNEFNVSINQAVPFGLLLNELITNSYKHAFNHTKDPKISLDLKESDGTIEFTYKDNGKGLSENDFETMNSLGLTLIRTLLRQIEADYKVDNSNHDGFNISFTSSHLKKGAQSNL